MAKGLEVMAEPREPGMGQLFSFVTGERFAHVIDTSYAEHEAYYTEIQLRELGLHEKFLTIALQHIRDLHLSLTSPPYILKPSQLTVHGVPEGRGEERKTVWRRHAVILREDIEERSLLLQESVKNQNLARDNEDLSQRCMSAAVDWIFHELCFEALGNSVLMQRRYCKYIPDFGNKDRNDQDQMRQMMTGDMDSDAAFQKFQRMKWGFGLSMLHELLLRHGIVDDMASSRSAVMIVKQGANMHDAMRIQELRSYMASLTPSPGNNPIGEWVMQVFDPDLEDQ